ncbi:MULTISPECIES: hypothetical protein [unclassified Phyllobacterium]|uniref:hypothetical protein n=1 Tax=unclassified Phyllobacterium TaxID=2638441 RepID=UPI0030131B8F
MTEGFGYSAQEKNRLAKILGCSEDHSTVSNVERIVGEWLKHNEEHVAVDLGKNTRIAVAAENLLREIEGDGGEKDFRNDFEENGHPISLRGHLLVAIEFLDSVMVENEHLLPKGRTPAIPRLLAIRLLEFWENSGRRIARSSTAKKDAPDIQNPSGPLVLFLLAATEPVLRTKVPLGAAEHAIRTFYPRRRTREDANFSEFVRSLIADGPHGESAAEK